MPFTFEELVNKVILFVKKNGSVVQIDSHNFFMFKHMKFVGSGIRIETKIASASGMSGWCWVIVKKRRKCVFEAEGNYLIDAFNVEAREYISGDWERLLL